MAVTDEILTRYKLDIQQPEQAMNKYAQTLMQTEEAGEKAFAGIGEAADLSGQRIANTGRIAEKSKFQFNSLGNSINQLSRELPAFTMNLNTGFLAISNNLPALADSIRMLKQQNVELAASGKQTASVLGSIASAVFSWQTALSVAITLLTAYGGKIVDFIAGNKEAKKSEEELRKQEEYLNNERMRGVNILIELNAQRGRDVTSLQKTRALRAGGLDLQRTELEILKIKGATDQEIYNKEQEIRENEILDLKELMSALELYGDDRLVVARQIDDKEREIATASTKFEAEQAEKAKKLAEEKAEFNAKADADFRKQQEETRQQASDEITLETDKYFNEKERQKKADEDAERQRRELLGESVANAYKVRADRFKVLSAEASDQSKTFEERKEALTKMYDEFLLTEQEYTKATNELAMQRKMAALNTISSIASALGSFSQILGENTEAGKALAIAQTTIDTYVAAQKAYLSQLQFDPSAPIRATIAAAAAVASGLARVAAIASTSVPKPSKSSAQVPSAESRGFKDGIVDIDGPGTGTSDSIPVWLSRGESVITARSTSAKSDELEALNHGVVNYEMLLYKKYVKPAIDAEQEKQNQFAANVARSIAMHSAFNDTRIVKAIEKNRPATGKDIAKLADSIAKQNRIAKFESNLKQSK